MCLLLFTVILWSFGFICIVHKLGRSFVMCRVFIRNACDEYALAARGRGTCYSWKGLCPAGGRSGPKLFELTLKIELLKSPENNFEHCRG